MDIDLTGFSATQKQALFDLLILAMYADGHLSSVEDEHLQKLLEAMGFVDEIDRQREFDAAVTRMPCRLMPNSRRYVASRQRNARA